MNHLNPPAETSNGGRHVASIVHLTDTHLFVDGAGAARPATHRSRLVRFLAKAGVEDLEFASDDVVSRLGEQLTAAVREERGAIDGDGPVVVVHSGDVEAFGANPHVSGFTGFDHLVRLVAEAQSDGVVAVYGNHDVWPGTVALLGLNGPRHDAQKRAIDRHASFIGELPPAQPPRFPTPNGVDLVFVPINSVFSHPIRGGLLANGRISPHPPGTGDVFDRLRQLQLRPDDLNIAVLHHPAHAGRPVTRRDRAGAGRLEQADAVAAELGRLGIDLMLSGHRHRLDPPFGREVDATAGDQPPLPPNLAQLVALSPTMESHAGLADIEAPNTPRRGLCVYRIIVDECGTSLSIDRLIHPTDAPAMPTFERSVISQLSLGNDRSATRTGANQEGHSRE